MRILVTGGNGQVGRAVAAASAPGHEVHAPGHDELDVGDPAAVGGLVRRLEPEAIVNTAAMTAVDDCERDPDAAFRTNALALRHLAVAADACGAHVVHVSTDHVFDGESDRPYDEWDRPAPISVYGRSKLGGELELAAHARSWAIARTSWVFGRAGSDFVSWVLDSLGHGELPVDDDQESTPTDAADLAVALARLATVRRQGLFHVTNGGSCSRFGMARTVVELAGGDPERVVPVRGRPRVARRPRYSVLDDRAWRLVGEPPLRHYRDALADRLGREGVGSDRTTAAPGATR